MTLRPVCEDDIQLISTWYACDQEGLKRLNFYAKPRKWLLLLGDNRFGWIAQNSDGDVGLVDIEREGGVGHMAFYIAPQFRRQGLAKHLLVAIFLVAEGMGLKVLRGGFEGDNIASRKALERAGFDLSPGDDEGMFEASRKLRNY